MSHLTNDYLETILGANPDLDRARVKKALDFAVMAHDGQKRKSGEPFIIHPIEVSKILAEWGMDTDTVVAGLLHDTVEDGGAFITDIIAEFGESVAFMVEGVTKLGTLRLRGSEEDIFVENLRKMFVAMAKDLRVVIVKLADRLHNMRTLQFLPENKQTRIAKETLEVFAPLADRLQMGKAKAELEDLAFKYLYPENFEDIQKVVRKRWKNSAVVLEKNKRRMEKFFEGRGLKVTVSARTKHLYSLFRKLQRQEIAGDLEKIHDFYAFRIITSSIPECYEVLSHINESFSVIENIGVSDYIVKPKANGYQSIHLKVFDEDQNIVEVQIRTSQMHEHAELGVASHFNYAQAKAKGANDESLEKGVKASTDKLAWVVQLANWQRDIKDNKAFYEDLQKDFLSDRIFVFTPKGDVKDLPVNSTPIDFAYSVHTDLGNRAVGAKVNGKAAGFDTKLKSGDVCEIIESERGKPKIDWLKFVVTTQAKREINRHHKK